MKTLILAAGRSRRVKPIEDKNFLKFMGKTLLEHQMEELARAGFEDQIIVAGAHNIEAIREIAGDAQVVEQIPLDGGMAAGVLAAEELVGEEALFIVSSNDVVDPQAYETVRAAIDSDADAYLTAVKVDRYFPGGYLKVDSGRITDIVEKPGEGNEPSDLVNIVLHVYKQPSKLFEALKTAQSSEDDVYEVAMAKLMAELQFEPIAYDGFWQPVKYPWHVFDLMDHFFELMEPSVHESAQIAETAVIKGKVLIAKGVRIFDHATIQGPAYIGPNSIVGNNALVRGSIVGANSVVGYSTEVARSYVSNDCWFHSNYIGDSILGENCSFGAGAVCANLRLDEAEIAESGRNKLGVVMGDHVRVGVNTSLMPGVRIGGNSMIGSGLVVSEDIEPGKFVYAKTELVQKDNRLEMKDLKR